jgi:hypothetical protein
MTYIAENENDLKGALLSLTNVTIPALKIGGFACPALF